MVSYKDDPEFDIMNEDIFVKEIRLSEDQDIECLAS